MDFINKSIFTTNQFAMHNPELHKKFWKEFEQTTPSVQRNAYYGADSVEYIKFLKKNHPTELHTFERTVGGIVVG